MDFNHTDKILDLTQCLHGRTCLLFLKPREIIII
jgi:hypothetical protein